MIRNITLSSEDALIEQAQRRATAEGTTLNDLFREWLRRYVAQPAAADVYDDLMSRLNHIRAGRKFMRDEAND